MPASDRYDGDSSSTEDDESVQAFAPLRNGETSSRSQYSYNMLFKLDSLMNVQLPRGSDCRHSCSSSDGQSDSGNGNRLNGYTNGIDAERPSDVQSEMTMKRKRVHVEADAGCNSARRDESDSNEENENGSFEISEERYRAMLSEHLQRFKRARVLEVISSRSSVAALGKRDNAKHGANGADIIVANGIGRSNCPHSGFVKQYVRKHRTTKGEQDENNFGNILVASEPQPGTLVEHVIDAAMPVSGILDPALPPPYAQSAHLRHVPDYVAFDASDVTRSGSINSIVPMMVSDPRADLWQLRAGMGERVVGGQTLGGMFRMIQEDIQKPFPLPVFDSDRVGAVHAEGSSGPGLGGIDEPPLQGLLSSHQGSPITMRQISSDGGMLKHCEVKIMERGDGYEVIQRKVHKEETRRDPDDVAKEDFDKIGRHWGSLVRKDLPKHQKLFMTFHRRQLQDIKRFAEFCQREVKTRNIRSLKLLRAAPMRTRRLARDMVIFWKKVDKEQAELRKKEEKDAADSLKREEELREAKRQQQRLNFLLTQTELYSHFMQNKLAGGSTASSEPASAGLSSDEAGVEAEFKEEAIRAATKAASQQLSRTNAFDSESSKLRHAADVEIPDQEGSLVDSVADIDLLNPSTMPTTSSVQQPKLFQGILKEYQLKGLQWLVNCYEQGLNGILADEMGLGKTIQAMAFLAHLAEEKKIWGPFLVVAPASVLNNWADEVNRFCPDLKILPYWGGLNERTVLRKNINPKRLYKREAAFHVLITSYQLLVSDEKYFRRVKWQYMILDEAQAIKSASSLRWKTLLSFNCRNRLLLTGTPIQNSMAELWALLHFIMPTLFDSHEQFSEWFSKGIESHAEHGGTLNEHQLTRLHAILKPFMLRRVKKDVITEMTNKKELMVPCTLSKRQQAFYRAIKNKISVADLFDSKGAMNEKKVLNLMNIVIQLRKVCNHPELFERNEGHSFFQFATLTSSLLPPTFGEPEDIHYSGWCNPISYKVPKLLYRDGMPCLPTESTGSCQGFSETWLRNRFSIYSSDHIQESIFPRSEISRRQGMLGQSSFGFSRFLDLSPSEVEFLAKASTQERWLYSFYASQDASWTGEILASQDSTCDKNDILDENYEDHKARAVKRMLMVPAHSNQWSHKKQFTGLASEPFDSLIIAHSERFLRNVGLLRTVRSYIPPVQAPQIDVSCSDRGFAYQRVEELEHPWISRLLIGFSRTSDRNGPALPQPPHYLIEEQDCQLQQQDPLLALPFRVFGSAPPVQSFDFAKMLTDSGKLHTLDGLLKQLKAGNHRILLFAQMTKMLNILEDYMNYRKYKYLRLDGSSTIMDRRDMVKDFQHRGDIFVFLLSTRAGGLGINLTAADTVIFYESDWNPTMDLQAMDRAHRLGQTKEVTVYRMICKGTVEEKIMKRASQKNTVQQLVMTGGQSQGDVFQAEEVVSLLLDDAELEQRLNEQKGPKQADKADKRRKAWGGGSAVKAVRLDAEGGGVSLDEEILPRVSDAPKTLHDVTSDSVGDKGVAGGAELSTHNSSQGGGRKRSRSEGRGPRAPKAPKPPREPKPRKDRTDRAQPRVPRPPRDPKMPSIRSGPKKLAEKVSGPIIPIESLVMASSIPDGVDQSPLVDSAINSDTGINMNLEIDSRNLPIISSDSKQEGISQSSVVDGEVDMAVEPESSPCAVLTNCDPKGVRVGKKRLVVDGVVVEKERVQVPKRLKDNSAEVGDVGSKSAIQSNSSRPLGTLKLSLRKRPAVESSECPAAAEDSS